MKPRLYRFTLACPPDKPYAVLTVVNPDGTAEFSFHVNRTATIKAPNAKKEDEPVKHAVMKLLNAETWAEALSLLAENQQLVTAARDYLGKQGLDIREFVRPIRGSWTVQPVADCHVCSAKIWMRHERFIWKVQDAERRLIPVNLCAMCCAKAAVGQIEVTL